ncbi:hypothetical protein J6590_071612 [Homalodisca vitripennis]|nr:hypothetical protein J6590_071612 [Homalodisca vitripennis]
MSLQRSQRTNTSLGDDCGRGDPHHAVRLVRFMTSALSARHGLRCWKPSQPSTSATSRSYPS